MRRLSWILMALMAASVARAEEPAAAPKAQWQPMDLLARAPMETGVFEGLTPPAPMESWKPVAKALETDSRMEEFCRDAAVRIDEKQAEILELKARYFARLLRSTTREFEVRKSLGAVITNIALRCRFYDRMRSYFELRVIPGLSKEEVERVSEVDSKSLALLRRCGLKPSKQAE